MILVLCVLAGVLIGSVPVAYLVVKLRHGLDVHTEGSGNVGANNAWRTTGSRRTGVVVMLLDALKGVAAVATGGLVAAGFGADPFWPQSLALLGAIAGHNYNPWLSLRAGRVVGGKGLAAAAGGFAVLMPWLVPVWGVLFIVGRWAFGAWRGVRDTIPGNVVATALVPFAALAVYGTAALVITLGLAALVLPKHAGQMRTLLKRSD